MCWGRPMSKPTVHIYVSVWLRTRTRRRDWEYNYRISGGKAGSSKGDMDIGADAGRLSEGRRLLLCWRTGTNRSALHINLSICDINATGSRSVDHRNPRLRESDDKSNCAVCGIDGRKQCQHALPGEANTHSNVSEEDQKTTVSHIIRDSVSICDEYY